MDYSECDEIADNMQAPRDAKSFDDVLRYVRSQMIDESETIICNVAESLWRRVKSTGV